MKTGNRHPKWKIVLASPVTMFVFLVLIFILSKAVLNTVDKVKIIDQKLDNANNEYSKLTEREKSLKERVDFLSTDTGIETELRSKYKAVSDGEKVAVILEDKVDASTTIATSTVTPSWWKRWFGWIGL